MAYDNSLAGKNNFLLTFNKAPKVQYFCQEVAVPDITIESTPINMGRAVYNEVGAKLEFSELTILFLVDENLTNYTEIFNWMMSLRDAQAGDMTAHTTSSENKSDALITILDNNKNPKVNFSFISCWPTVLGGLTYDVKAKGDEPQTATLTLAYSYFTLEKL